MCGRRDIEYQLRRAISGTGHFFLIDEPSIVDEVNGFVTFYRKFALQHKVFALSLRPQEFLRRDY